MSSIEQAWFNKRKWLWFLAPLTALFALIVWGRRKLYKHRWLTQARLPVPVVVVGNISVGGNGKTPVVIWLVEQLSAQGIRAGVVSRGYGAQAPHYPYTVSTKSTAKQVGDEPLLIHRRCACPVVVGPDRVAAVQQLLREHDCDVVISDDGMQHYRLPRQIEIAVIDGARRHGNGFLLPMGPLREPTSRLDEVDFIICNGDKAEDKEQSMTLVAKPWQKVLSNAVCVSEEFDAKAGVIAIAGIGNPQRFFDLLDDMGISVVQSIAFPDHHEYSEADFAHFNPNCAVVMTEKDAVKCAHLAQNNWWYLPVDAYFSATDSTTILNRIKQEITEYVI